MRIVKQHDSIMVMVDRLSKVAQFVLVKTTYLASEVAYVFIGEIVRLHGVLNNIFLDRDVKLTSEY